MHLLPEHAVAMVLPLWLPVLLPLLLALVNGSRDFIRKRNAALTRNVPVN